MKKIIIAGLVLSMSLVGLQTASADSISANVSVTQTNTIQTEKSQAMAKNTLLRNVNVISLQEWNDNDNVMKIAYMTTDKQLEAFNDYFVYKILTTPHGSVK